MTRNGYATKSRININELPYISYVNEDKRNDLYNQRRINNFTPTMINYINSKINSLYVKGVGIQCKDLVDTLFDNRPERNVYEGLVLAAFGLIATRSTKSNRVFYVKISDIGDTDFAPDVSIWHNLTESNSHLTNSIENSVQTVEDMISSTVENVIKKKYTTGNASVIKKVISNSNKASRLLHKLGKVFTNISEALNSAQV